MKLSICVPTRNRPAMVEELLEDFRSGLREKADPVEQKAIARFKAVLQKGQEAKRSAIWIDRAIEALNHARPREYPLEKAEKMLHDLGIDGEGERDAYYSDEEYAAALLGTTPDEIARQAGTSDPND